MRRLYPLRAVCSGEEVGGRERTVRTMSRPGSAWACVVVAAALVTTGCGTADDRVQVRQVSDALSAALARGDGRAACAQLSGETVKALEDQAEQPCAKAVTALGVKASPAQTVHV